ncbi:carboxypeptidase-like regulatory domain-containing protein [Winogradskyella helgolandensis]|uniref:carboxypeptidase-like regulatory domain-containing protein n=1 Tax=Winogradskyella helgolandensis TaxID=2697010 RepID=UPI0015BEFCB8|nr:carboxypeptidase-like regulatory domain-containing protein [Winogradskyella helgolandensis]
MQNQFNLDIKTPCSENFNQFSPTEKGGFCSSCEKEVIDFTQMNAEEIIVFLKNKSTQNTCGRFNKNQLGEYTKKPNNNKRLSFLSGIGLACVALFSSFTSQAQNTSNTIEPKQNTSEIKATKFEKNIIAKGNVTEGDSPLPGANVVLQGSTVGIATDFDGNFTFPEKLKIGDVLIISYLGFESQKVVIENKNSASKIELNIDMKVDSCMILGKVAVKEIYKSKRD